MNAGGNHCSKSYVQRWIFILCTYCCDFFEINLIPGCHIPQDGYNNNDDSQLNDPFSSMSITKERVRSSTGACQNIIKHRSERTYKEEQQRRLSCPPIEIVFHNDKKTLPPQPKRDPIPDEKPLRRPFTTPAVFLYDPSNSLDLDEKRFPSVGRGARPKEWGVANNSRASASYSSRLK